MQTFDELVILCYPEKSANFITRNLFSKCCKLETLIDISWGNYNQQGKKLVVPQFKDYDVLRRPVYRYTDRIETRGSTENQDWENLLTNKI